MEVLVEKILPHSPADVYALFTDLKNYPTFIPELAAVHILSSVKDETNPDIERLKTEAWVEAKSLSLKLKSIVEKNPKTRHVDVFYNLGPLKIAKGDIDFFEDEKGTRVRVHVVAKMVPSMIKKKIEDRIDEMTDRYTTVFAERCAQKLTPYA